MASWPDAPVLLRSSGEIDAYPANAPEWETVHDIEASEEINALFGYLSQFHETHGFYIDGVDAATATLPPDWRARQVIRPVNCDGREVQAIAPTPEDIAISKLCRGDDSDIDYVRALHASRPLDLAAMLNRVAALNAKDAIKSQVTKHIERLRLA